MATDGDGSVFDIAVVGGGPAGLTAATYAARFLRSCVVIDDGDSRAKWIPESNNCPGFPGGVSGVDLLRRMREQAVSFGARFEPGRIDAIRDGRDDRPFTLAAGDRTWQAHVVILATGICDRLPQVPWIGDAVACGAVRLCSVCDAYEARDMVIGVYGRAADIGAHALFLRGYSSRVYMLPCGDGDGGDGGDPPGASADIQRAQTNGVHLLAAGAELTFDGQRCRYRSREGEEVTFDTIYPFLGAETGAGIARAAGADLDDHGEIRVDRYQMTDVPRLFAIGDVVSGLNQIAVGVGQAAIATTRAHALLPLAPRRAASLPHPPA